jgi:hypothetical protein
MRCPRTPLASTVGPNNIQQENIMLIRELMTHSIEWTAPDTTLVEGSTQNAGSQYRLPSGW